MYINDIDAVSQSAANKAEICETQTGKYFIRSIIAGFYIVVAIILSNVTTATLYPTNPQVGKILGAVLFSIAIVLIVFIGGELFTGNNMTMAIGCYNKVCKVTSLIKVWILSYIGNFMGTYIFSFIFVQSGASQDILIEYYNSFIYDKLTLSPTEMVLRGVLCNFLVCLAVWTSTRMNSESGKLTVMICIIMTFVIAGFEHCIANMGTFAIAYMLLDGIKVSLIFKSMFFVTIGNILGGAVLLALPLKVMSGDK